MPSIRTRHIYAENVKEGDVIISMLNTIESVVQSEPKGQGWLIKTSNGGEATSHRTTVIPVVEVSVADWVNASQILKGDLLLIDDERYLVQEVRTAEESKHKLDIDLVKLNDTLSTETVTVGKNKRYLVLER